MDTRIFEQLCAEQLAADLDRGLPELVDLVDLELWSP